jgi:uncharacterized membrane protein YesL
MLMSGFGILRIPEWMIKIAFINFLWVCFSILGIIIFGIFPATIALFAVIRKWLMGETDIPIFKNFWAFYKKDFLKSNFLGLMLVVIGITLYIDYQLLQQVSSNLIQWVYYLLLTITFMFIMTFLYTFPVFVHYDISVFQVMKKAFLIMIISPLSTIMIIAGSIILYFTMTNFPGLIPIFGVSLLAFLIMWSTNLSFANIRNKNES